MYKIVKGQQKSPLRLNRVRTKNNKKVGCNKKNEN